MKATDAHVAEAMERVETALAEAEEAKRAHDDWLLAWRRRNGIPLTRHQEAAE